MSTTKYIDNRLSYIAPQIECVKLDTEISLALQSEPPVGPMVTKSPNYFNNDPLKHIT